jgi:NAD(P)-dependent dehydrogenase (short-subunit alcohol dehydrogenase family)
MGYSSKDLPPQSGRVFVITGASSGIGLEASLALAAVGARVVMACRDPGRAGEALARVQAASPSAQVETLALDLASLASIRAAAAELRQRHPRIDVLINNAGVMAIPRRETADGFEMQLGTNHLGHFAWTGLLLDRVEPQAGRVVTVASFVHHRGRMAWDDLMGEKAYSKWATYSQSKLANVLFMYELARRLKASGSKVKSVGCHPGYAATNLQSVGPRMEGASFSERIMSLGNKLFAQPAEAGAWPTLYAAVGDDIESADYTGPNGFKEMRGEAVKAPTSKLAKSEEDAARLWTLSEDLTAVKYPFAPPNPSAS